MSICGFVVVLEIWLFVICVWVFCLHACLSVIVCLVPEGAGAQGSQKWVSNPLKLVLQFQAVVSSLVWVLELKLRLRRAIGAFNLWVISPAPRAWTFAVRSCALTLTWSCTYLVLQISVPFVFYRPSFHSRALLCAGGRGEGQGLHLHQDATAPTPSI